ncbi:carboxypeptidase-like regulatory domain-containing protein [Aurantibacter crassamenti]|uniref:carboxypeptidase-like regulatory domain-containing protein n=1 Tax=Aurantibacter crassamenti TaxID=1837375 RepID=UPI00193A4493|nr:carboxypeptidase-like regulatory domain-containing protein [Aurantibacter crassamenti]MBM1106342.1 carboxypeptidase-like regulatory domain-containing protein [Aurantibacter crassamenti]
MRFLLVPLLLVAQLSAQEVLFEGNVLDSKTKEPIPYVNLSFLNTLKGTSTDEKGHFYIDIPKTFLENKVHISSLGYKDTIITAKNLYASKIFKLVEKSFELDEVVVSKSLGDSYVLNPISSYSLTGGFASSATPWVLALYFPNIGSQAKVIENVTVFMQKNPKFNDHSSKFRIRIYDVDPITKAPNKDLVRKSLVLESELDKDYVSLDLSSLNIKIPKEGVYIGLEWLFISNNWFRNVSKHPITKKQIVEDRFAPTFSGVYVKNQNYRAMVYGMGKWTDFTVKSKNGSENFVPAISLKIKKSN